MSSQLALKSRIISTQSLGKIFKAQEMIASSHIAKSRDIALNAKPYSDAIFDAVQALVAHHEEMLSILFLVKQVAVIVLLCLR